MTDGDQRRTLTAPFRLRNYRALFHSFHTYRSPLEGLRRYVTGRGAYPWPARLRTPTGDVTLELPHPHDVRTVNEVFCRRDYGSGAPRVVVDVGANIGVSAVYFLSRRPDSVVYCWEPHPKNRVALQTNLGPFSARCHIYGTALAPAAGKAVFVAEPVGRYSGLSAYAGAHRVEDEITVECEAIGPALRSVIDREGRIDLLKIDTEGSEESLIAAIPRDVWGHVDRVVYETPGRVVNRTGASFLS